MSLKVLLGQQNSQVSAVWNELLSKHTKLKHLKALPLCLQFQLVSLLWNARWNVDSGLLELNWLEEITVMMDLHFADKGLGCRHVFALFLSSIQNATDCYWPRSQGSKTRGFLMLIFQIVAGWSNMKASNGFLFAAFQSSGLSQEQLPHYPWTLSSILMTCVGGV